MKHEARSKTWEEQGNRLRILRRKKGLSQNELAEKIGVSRYSIIRWERGYCSITCTAQLLETLGCTTGELLRGEKKEKVTSELKRLYRHPGYDSLSTEEKAILDVLLLKMQGNIR